MKMIDILSEPSNKTNSNAFSAMEKEITNVLSVIKTNDTKLSTCFEEKIDRTDLYKEIDRLDNVLMPELKDIKNSKKFSNNIVNNENFPIKYDQNKVKTENNFNTNLKHNKQDFKNKMEAGDTIKQVNNTNQLDNDFKESFNETTENSKIFKNSNDSGIIKEQTNNSVEEKWSEQLHEILNKMENVYKDLEGSDNNDIVNIIHFFNYFTIKNQYLRILEKVALHF